MGIVKAENTNKKQTKTRKDASLKAQERLAEILNDSPHIVSLNGTEWEIRALRMGTQWLIAQEVIKIKKAESATFGDIINQFAVNIPSVIKVLTLALLNDKDKIYKGGDEKKGFSELYESTYNTISWECNINELGGILLETLQLLNIDFFLQAVTIVDMFRTSVTARKTTMMKVQK